jgi:hypothetical protein
MQPPNLNDLLSPMPTSHEITRAQRGDSLAVSKVRNYVMDIWNLANQGQGEIARKIKQDFLRHKDFPNLVALVTDVDKYYRSLGMSRPTGWDRLSEAQVRGLSGGNRY